MYLSLDGRKYWSQKQCPRWWDGKVSFHNLKSGYSKETLVRFITKYRHYEHPSGAKTSKPISPIRDRSPYSSSPHLFSSTPLEKNKMIVVPKAISDTSSPILPAPPEFLDSPRSITPRSIISESGIFQDNFSNYGQEVEIFSEDSWDSRAASSTPECQSIQPYFPSRKSLPDSSPSPSRKSLPDSSPRIKVNRDEDVAAALSELSGKDTLLTDVTIHAFMVCCI